MKKFLIVILIVQLLCTLGFSFSTPFLPLFIGELGTHSIQEQAWWSGIMLAMSGICLTIFSPFWGFIADKYSRKLMLLRVLFGGAIFIYLRTLVHTVPQLIIIRTAQSAITGSCAAINALTTAVLPKDNRGFALGLLQAVSFAGMALGPIIGGFIADWYGYRVIFCIGAMLLFLAGVITVFGIKEQPIVSEVAQLSNFKFISVLISYDFIITILSLSGMQFAMTLNTAFFPLLLAELVSTNVATTTGILIAVTTTVGVISALICGYLGDKFGYNLITIICCSCLAIAACGHYITTSLYVIFFLRILFGFGMFGIAPVASAAVCNICGTNNVGKAYGIVLAISSLGGVAGGYIGSVVAYKFGVSSTFLLLGILQLIIISFLLGTMYASNSFRRYNSTQSLN